MKATHTVFFVNKDIPKVTMEIMVADDKFITGTIHSRTLDKECYSVIPWSAVAVLMKLPEESPTE